MRVQFRNFALDQFLDLGIALENPKYLWTDGVGTATRRAQGLASDHAILHRGSSEATTSRLDGLETIANDLTHVEHFLLPELSH